MIPKHGPAQCCSCPRLRSGGSLWRSRGSDHTTCKGRRIDKNNRLALKSGEHWTGSGKKSASDSVKEMDNPASEEIRAEPKSDSIEDRPTVQHMEVEPAPHLHIKTFLVVAVSWSGVSTISGLDTDMFLRRSHSSSSPF